MRKLLNLFVGQLPFHEDIKCCYVLVDGHVIGDQLDFRMAVMAMFATYFVFNIEYPEKAAASLEYIQRYAWHDMYKSYKLNIFIGLCIQYNQRLYVK